MPRAATVLSFEPGGTPVSVLVDYDGTISRVDVGDALLDRFHDNEAELAALDAQYDAGTIGSRELLRWDMEVLPRDPALLREAAAGAPQDESFVDLVSVARQWRAAVEVVSDGLGFYVESNLRRLGISELPIATNESRVGEGGRGMTFPFGHPECFVCGTCKRERVRAHQAAGRVVLFVGDGTSDRFAAAHADVVFAKRMLARLCRRQGWPFHAWDTLGEVAAWIDGAFESGTLPRRASDLAAWNARSGREPRPFICGPEVWGPGRTTPGPGPDRVAGAMSSVEGSRASGDAQSGTGPRSGPHTEPKSQLPARAPCRTIAGVGNEPGRAGRGDS